MSSFKTIVALGCCILLFALTECRSSKEPYVVNKPAKDSILVIQGLAKHLVEGAGLLSNGSYYFLEGKDNWNDSLIGKRFEVKGVYYTIYWKKIKTKKGELYPPRMQGLQKIIRNATITRLPD